MLCQQTVGVSVSRDEFFDNHRGNLERPKYQVEKEEIQRLFDIYNSWTKVSSTLSASQKPVLERLILL